MSNLPAETPKVLELPILKHFEKSEISLNPQNWRKGEKGIAGVLGLALLAVAGWGIFTYVLPVVLIMVGKVLGAILSAILVIGFFIFLFSIDDDADRKEVIDLFKGNSFVLDLVLDRENGFRAADDLGF